VRERGCTEAQGYLFARPMSAEDLRAFMATYAARRAAA
jgi:EAL domain-containing protein (putative c-di-GMP-specific phosphodiesterase class I)